MSLKCVSCFHGNALIQRKRMGLNRILWLLSNINLLCIAYSEAEQLIAHTYQIRLVWVCLRKKYVSTLSILTDPRINHECVYNHTCRLQHIQVISHSFITLEDF